MVNHRVLIKNLAKFGLPVAIPLPFVDYLKMGNGRHSPDSAGQAEKKETVLF